MYCTSDHHLIKSVCVRTDLSCCHPMEVPYFSSGAFPRICLTVPLLRTSKSGLGLRGSTQFVALPTSPSWQREKGSSLPNNKACLYSSEAPFFLNNSNTDIIRFISCFDSSRPEYNPLSFAAASPHYHTRSCE